MPNVFPQSYQTDQSISVLRVVGWYFSFYSDFKRNFCKQTVENLIRRRILRRLIWFCTVWRCPTKRTPGFYGLTHWYETYTYTCNALNDFDLIWFVRVLEFAVVVVVVVVVTFCVTMWVSHTTYHDFSVGKAMCGVWGSELGLRVHHFWFNYLEMWENVILITFVFFSNLKDRYKNTVLLNHICVPCLYQYDHVFCNKSTKMSLRYEPYYVVHML